MSKMKTNNRKSGKTYYVAGLARYVLVQVRSSDEARAKGEEKLERPAHVVRLATPNEIGLQAFHDRMIREIQRNDQAPLIHAYTRSQAIQDSVLVDVSVAASDAGIKWPVALTRAVWCRYVEVQEGVKYQGERDRLWDLLWTLLKALRSSTCGPCDTIHYQLNVRNDNGAPKPVTLKAVCGPDDEGTPSITVMTPEED